MPTSGQLLVVLQFLFVIIQNKALKKNLYKNFFLKKELGNNIYYLILISDHAGFVVNHVNLKLSNFIKVNHVKLKNHLILANRVK